ncbi:MAG: VanZ family protein [Planctomycetota bacterium]
MPASSQRPSGPSCKGFRWWRPTGAPRPLFLLVAGLITYGSLFPFEFHPAEEIWERLLQSWGERTSRGDLLSNIVLFVPLGYLGMLALQRPRGRVARATVVLLLSALFGVGLQVAQVHVAGRDPSLMDALWNLVGATAGVFLGAIPRLHPDRVLPELGSRTPAAWVLIGSWLGYRLLPFVPSLDWQQFKDSLKPLLLHPDLSWFRVFHDTVAWTVVAALWSRAYPRRFTVRYLPLLMAAVFFLEVLIVRNVISANNVSGAALALALWFLLFRHARPRAIALLLAAMLVVVGLWPFEARESPATFHLVPFHGFLAGSMFHNTAVLLEKIFLYGSLVWLLRETGARLITSTVLATLLATVIELGQIHFAHHTPEITDTLMIPLLATVIGILDGPRESAYSR